MPGIPALWRQKGHKFKTSLPYIVNSCLRRNTEGVEGVCDDISLSSLGADCAYPWEIGTSLIQAFVT